MPRLIDLAYIIRSKNAGPFQITFDIFFKSREIYEDVKRRGVFSKELVSRLFNISVEDVKGIYYIDAVYAVKITLRRNVASGSIYDKDVYGAQQHQPLINLTIPLEEDRTIY